MENVLSKQKALPWPKHFKRYKFYFECKRSPCLVGFALFRVSLPLVEQPVSVCEKNLVCSMQTLGDHGNLSPTKAIARWFMPISQGTPRFHK